ncbi:ribonuclease H-like domain-containing protein [Tanacetum coccineum]
MVTESSLKNPHTMPTEAVQKNPELFLDELDVGVTETIVVMGNIMHCTMKGNIAHNFIRLKKGGIYPVKNFAVQPNKDEFCILKNDAFMLEFDGATTVRKAFVKADGFVKYPFQLVDVDNLEPTNNTYLIDKLLCVPYKLYLSSNSSTLILDDDEIPVVKELKVENSGVELNKEGLSADNSEPKDGTIENLLMWAYNWKNNVCLLLFAMPLLYLCSIALHLQSHCISNLQPSIAKLELEVSDETAKAIVVMFDETATTLEEMDLETAQITTTAKFPTLKQGEYDMWRLRIEQYFQVQDYALWDVIENGNSFKPATKITTNADGTSTTLVPGPVTTKEKVQKKNDMKARSMLLMALPNEHLMTFNQYKDAKTLFAAIQTRFGGNEATKKTQKTLLKQMYENFSAPSTESLDFIFNRLQKIVSQLAILGENISQEDLNLKFLRSLPSEWNTHVVVWRNKPDLDTMSFDDLYNNFKIVEQEVKGTASSSLSSNYRVSTTNTQVSPASTHDSTASIQISTTNLCDDTVYVFLVSQPNGSQLVHEDLEQIHEDNLEEMNLKWQLVLLSMRTRRGPRNQDSRNMNQDSSRRTVNVEETSSKAMLAIDGADSEVHNDKTCSKTYLKSFETLKTQLDDLRIEFNKSEFNLANYKRGLASVEEQLVFYKKNEVIFCEQLAVLKRDISYKDSEISMLKSELEKLKQEKESNQLKIEKFDNASKSLDKLIGSQIPDKSRKGLGFVSYNAVPPPPTGLFSPPNLDLSNSGLEEFQQPEFEGYGPKTSKNVSEDTSNEVRESPDAPMVEKLVSDDKLEKKTIFPTVAKIEFVRPKQQEKPVRKPVKYAEMYRSQGPRGNQRNWNNQKSQQLGSDFVMYNKACFVCGSFDHVQANCNYHQRERVVSGNNYTRVNYNYSTKKAHPSAHRNMAPRAVLMKTGLRPLNTARPVNTAHPKTTVYSARPMSHFSKSAQSTVKRPYQIKTALTNKNFSQKVNTAKGSFYTARPKVVNTARPNSAVVNAVRANQVNAVKASACWVWRPTKLNSASITLKRHNYVDAREVENALRFLRPFRCHVSFSKSLDYLGKFDGKSDEGFFIGYTLNSKTFRVYNIRTRKIEENLHIRSNSNDSVVTGVQNKKDERGIVVRNKARLVTQGYTQEEGIEYDEVFAPVSMIEAIRLFLAYASFKDFVVYQMDVKSAFLYGKIEEEVYVCQPLGFEDLEFPNRVYKVEKALYCLHQALRAWYETLSTYLLENGFQRGTIDKTLFIKRVKADDAIQFWQTATASTLDNREMEITATIDGKVKIETEVPQLNSPLHTKVADEVASTCADVRYGGATTTVTGFEVGHGSGNIDKTPTMPHDSPLPRVHTLGSDEGRMQHNELMDLVTKLLDRVVALKTDLTQTKKVYGAAFTKLINKVKRLEKKDKLSKSRRKLRLVLSDEEGSDSDILAQEDPSKQGRKIAQIDEDEGITLVQMVFLLTASPEVKTAGVFVDDIAAESLVYIKRSASKTKDKGKGIMEVYCTSKGVQQRQKIKIVARLQEEFYKEERQRIARVHEAARPFSKVEWEDIRARVEAFEELVQRLQTEDREKYSEDDQAKMIIDLINQRKRYFATQKAEAKRNKPMTQAHQRTYMSNYIKHMGNYKLQQLKRLSFNEIKDLFETTMRRGNTFVPMETEIRRGVPEATEEEFGQKSSKKKKLDELSQEELQQLMIIVPEEGMNIEALQTKYPIID